MSTKAIVQLATPRFEPLGLVWMDCHYPMLSAGLESVLETKARLHRGGTPPAERPSVAVCCLHTDEDVGQRIARLKGSAGGAPVLAFGLSADAVLARAALRAGARGFLHCGMEPAQIVRAVSVAIRGEVVIPRGMLGELVAENATPNFPALTARQREVLDLVALGMTNVGIADRLFLAESTVKQHLRGAYKALGARNRLEAVRAFLDVGGTG